jgi:hypothetical protein
MQGLQYSHDNWLPAHARQMDSIVRLATSDGITADLRCYFFGGDLNLFETLNRCFGLIPFKARTRRVRMGGVDRIDNALGLIYGSAGNGLNAGFDPKCEDMCGGVDAA